MTDDVDVRVAVEGELALLDPDVRSSPGRAGELLHEEFTEVGASGRRWDRPAILTAMAGDLSLAGEQVQVLDMTGVRIGTDVVHLTYVTEHDGVVVRRSSIWRRSGDRWQLWFHQGTPDAGLSPTAAGGRAGE